MRAAERVEVARPARRPSRARASRIAVEPGAQRLELRQRRVQERGPPLLEVAVRPVDGGAARRRSDRAPASMSPLRPSRRSRRGRWPCPSRGGVARRAARRPAGWGRRRSQNDAPRGCARGRRPVGAPRSQSPRLERGERAVEHLVFLEAEGVDLPEILGLRRLDFVGEEGFGLVGRPLVERRVALAQVRREGAAGVDHGPRQGAGRPAAAWRRAAASDRRRTRRRAPSSRAANATSSARGATVGSTSSRQLAGSPVHAASRSQRASRPRPRRCRAGDVRRPPRRSSKTAASCMSAKLRAMPPRRPSRSAASQASASSSVTPRPLAKRGDLLGRTRPAAASLISVSSAFR